MKKILFFLVLSLIPLFFYQTNAHASTQSREAYEKTGRVIWEVNTKKKLVALTFDDGPHPILTPKILKILAKYNAKATFFVSGNKAVKYPYLIRQEVKEGHEIGNHTFNHIYGSKITQSTLSLELEKTDRIIQRFTGFNTNLYRPVGGFFNDAIINTAIKNKKNVILWSWHQDTRDWANPPVNEICRQVISGVKPGDIIIFHDWHGSQLTETCKTVPALTTILDYLYKNGYTCVTVSELLYRSTQIIPESYNIFPSKRTQTSQINLMF